MRPACPQGNGGDPGKDDEAGKTKCVSPTSICKERQGTNRDLEIGSSKDPSRLQCVSHSLRTTVVITWHPQTELAINTHVTVSETHTMVSDLHRTIVHGQEGNGGKHSVSGIRTPATPGWLLITPQIQAGSVI